jgi:hypothetical protein
MVVIGAVLTLGIAGGAFLLSVITFYLTHFKGADITLSIEGKKAMLEELDAKDFVNDIPTRLRGKISLFVLNKGNRTGALRFTDVKFNPMNGFAKFFKECHLFLESAKSAPDSRITPGKTLIIRDGDADTIDMHYDIDLNPMIRYSYDYNLESIDIENENLRKILYDLEQYKKDRLEEFNKFLKDNDKIGEIEIPYEHTKKQWLNSNPFKKETIPIEVVHSFEETLRCYEDASQNFKLLPSKEEIIENVLKEVNILKYIFDQCYNDIETHPGEGLFGFGQGDHIQSTYFARVRDEIELLKKCKVYKNIFETEIEPVLREILAFNQKTVKAAGSPDGMRKQSLIDELQEAREPLRKRIIFATTTIKDLEKMIE